MLHDLEYRHELGQKQMQDLIKWGTGHPRPSKVEICQACPPVNGLSLEPALLTSDIVKRASRVGETFTKWGLLELSADSLIYI